MAARGDFRHHAAEWRMFSDLRVDDVGKNRAGAVVTSFHQRRGGFVAGGFDAENDHELIALYRPLSRYDDIRFCRKTLRAA